jgi:hypothetical protein
MDRFPDEIIEHYDREIDEARRITHGLGQLELLRTREIVRRHLPPGPQRILDVGGGTGVHAAWLADDGHHVHLIDRVPGTRNGSGAALPPMAASPPSSVTPATSASARLNASWES